MARYQFNNSERFAVWRAYDGNCFWCTKPLAFREMEVDHLIAESLADEPKAFEKLCKNLGLSATYNVNDFPNWVCACRDCNGRKGATKFPPSTMILFLIEKAAKVGEVCRAYANELISDRQKNLLLSRLAAATENNSLTEAELQEVGAKVLANLAPVIRTLRSHTSGLHIEGDWVIVQKHSNGTATVVGPQGYGITPVGSDPDPTWLCSHCGSYGPWRGINCVLCGNSQEPEVAGY